MRARAKKKRVRSSSSPSPSSPSPPRVSLEERRYSHGSVERLKTQLVKHYSHDVYRRAREEEEHQLQGSSGGRLERKRGGTRLCSQIAKFLLSNGVKLDHSDILKSMLVEGVKRKGERGGLDVVEGKKGRKEEVSGWVLCHRAKRSTFRRGRD